MSFSSHTGWDYVVTELTFPQMISLISFPISFVSLMMGSMAHHFYERELRDDVTLKDRAFVAPYYLVTCTTKVWVLCKTRPKLWWCNTLEQRKD